jgi:osmotically-inducible protein OsmY
MSEAHSTDDGLRSSVLQTLAEDTRTAALDLRVGVLNGVVHLGGAAPSQELWRLAETIAARVVGVRGVVNRIEAPGAPSPMRKVNIPMGDKPREER